MSVAVVSYPNISKDDYSFIKTIRNKYDVYYRLIAPHFTIVFPGDFEQDSYIKHIKMQIFDIKKIRFVIRSATIDRDASGEMSNVFLVPDEGFSDIVKLHDTLYTGILTSSLRLDIPFTPHINIGNSADPKECKKLADQLNGQGLVIKGIIDTLDILSVNLRGKYPEFDGEINTIESVGLN